MRKRRTKNIDTHTERARAREIPNKVRYKKWKRDPIENFPIKKKCGKIASNQRMNETKRTNEGEIQRYVYLTKIIPYRCCFFFGHFLLAFSLTHRGLRARARGRSLASYAGTPRALFYFFSRFRRLCARVYVWVCVALNAIASRLRAYFVFSCNLTPKRTSHRSVRQLLSQTMWRRADSESESQRRQENEIVFQTSTKWCDSVREQQQQKRRRRNDDDDLERILSPFSHCFRCLCRVCSNDVEFLCCHLRFFFWWFWWMCMRVIFRLFHFHSENKLQ